MTAGSLHRLSAFTLDPNGGNPAGVWVGEVLPTPPQMQRLAAEVGYSETAFIAPTTGFGRTVRYFSPEAEVSFCGHATIAAGVLLGEAGGPGTYRLASTVGEVPVDVHRREGRWEASLTSVEPKHQPADANLVRDALAALRWDENDLSAAMAPARAYAGAWHLVLAINSRSRLADLDYDFNVLKTLMLNDGLTTLQLVWQERQDLFHSRNPFPVGGVAEDPATGAAAAALGGYLRDAGLVALPATIVVRQGEDMGRPSKIVVDIPPVGGIIVTGTAVAIER